MFSPAFFQDLVSGRSRGVLAGCGRAALGAIEVPYRIAVRLRNHCYDAGGRVIHRVEVPVISVGNLTLGGTGKTPMVAWLARWFAGQGTRVVMVSRGYGAKPGQLNDEARELSAQLPAIPHVQLPDRHAAARQAIDQYGAEVILLDDGFQHRRLARDLDIVLIDALQPFGYDHVFPRGTLREPISGLRRADVVMLSRADLIGKSRREQLQRQIAQYAPGAAYCELIHRPQVLVDVDGEEQPLAHLAGRRVAAFSGIGNPAGFRHTLDQCGYEVAAWREFPDHHAYRREEIEGLESWALEHRADAIVCTHKDLVKINSAYLGKLRWWAVSLSAQPTTGRETLEHRLFSVHAPLRQAA